MDKACLMQRRFSLEIKLFVTKIDNEVSGEQKRLCTQLYYNIKTLMKMCKNIDVMLMLIYSCVSIFVLANGNAVNIWMRNLLLSLETRVHLTAGRRAVLLSD